MISSAYHKENNIHRFISFSLFFISFCTSHRVHTQPKTHKLQHVFSGLVTLPSSCRYQDAFIAPTSLIITSLLQVANRLDCQFTSCFNNFTSCFNNLQQVCKHQVSSSLILTDLMQGLDDVDWLDVSLDTLLMLILLP